MKVQGFAAVSSRALGALLALAFAIAAGNAWAMAVSGRITQAPDGVPIAGAEVFVSGGAEAVSLWTDADGRYAVEYDCLYAQCSLRINADGHVWKFVDFDGSLPSFVGDYALAREAVIAGRVVFPAGFVPPAELPVQDWPSVYGQDAAGHWGLLSSAPVSPQDGSFRIDKLPAGSYKVCVSITGLLRQCFDGEDQGAFPNDAYTPVIVAAGEVRNDVDFAPRLGSRIGGQVSDAYAGAPLGGGEGRFTLVMYDENRAPLDQFLVTPDAQGRYAHDGIPPGRYYLLALPSTFMDRFYPDTDCAYACDAQTMGTLVTVPPDGAADDVDFAFRPYAVVRTRVIDAATGEAVAGASTNGWYPNFHLGGLDATYDWFDVATHEYVTYNIGPGLRISAQAPGYRRQFILGGDCDDLGDCVTNYPPLLQAQGDVLRVEVRLSRRPDALFQNGFE